MVSFIWDLISIFTPLGYFLKNLISIFPKRRELKKGIFLKYDRIHMILRVWGKPMLLYR